MSGRVAVDDFEASLLYQGEAVCAAGGAREMS